MSLPRSKDLGDWPPPTESSPNSSPWCSRPLAIWSPPPPPSLSLPARFFLLPHALSLPGFKFQLKCHHVTACHAFERAHLPWSPSPAYPPLCFLKHCQQLTPNILDFPSSCPPEASDAFIQSHVVRAQSRPAESRALDTCWVNEWLPCDPSSYSVTSDTSQLSYWVPCTPSLAFAL